MLADKRTDLVVEHEELPGTGDVAAGLRAWAELVVRHLLQDGAPAQDTDTDGGRPT